MFTSVGGSWLEITVLNSGDWWRHVTHDNICSACWYVLVKQVLLCESLSTRNLSPLFLTPSFICISLWFLLFSVCLFNFYVLLSFSIQMLKIVFIFFGILPITYLRSGSCDFTQEVVYRNTKRFPQYSYQFIMQCGSWKLAVNYHL